MTTTTAPAMIMTKPRTIRALLIDAARRSIDEVTIEIIDNDEIDRKWIAALLHCEMYTLHDWLDDDDDDNRPAGDVLQAEDGFEVGADPRHWFKLDGGEPIPGFGLVSGYGPDYEDVSARISLEALRARVTFHKLRRIVEPIDELGGWRSEVISEN